MRWLVLWLLIFVVTPIFGQSSNEKTQKLQKNYQSRGSYNYHIPYRPPVVRQPIIRSPYYVAPLPNYYWNDWRTSDWNRPQINNYYYGATPIYGRNNAPTNITHTYKTPKTELKNTIGILLSINPNYDLLS